MIRNLSVRYKFTAIAVATTAIILILASLAFVALEINNYRRSLAQELTAIAQITSSNLTAAIIFDDRAAAQETLAALGARPNIESAAIYTPDGRLFARHSPGEPQENLNPGPRPATLAAGATPAVTSSEPSLGSKRAYELEWTAQSVDLYGPIGFDGDVIGAIQIRSNLDQINATIETYLSVVVMIVLLAIALAWLLASLLQRSVTQPIFGLLDTVRTVTNERDYSLRADKRSSDELGALVDGFNAMLAETEAHKTELSTARQQAESANRLKSDFLAQMSHELRTPLNAILGFSDFMMNEPHGPLGHENYREYMRDIQNGGQHLLGVINDILDLSKIEAGGTQLVEDALDTEELIDESIRLLRERAETAGIGLRAEIEPGLPHLYGDGKLIKRGLLNLLSNAIKFTPARGQITVRADEESNGAITLTVIDNGIGIAPQQIEHVMSPFGQAENVMTRSQDGTGLGLPLVKSFMDLHGGSIELRSALGEGTKVALRFPVERTRARPTAATPTLKEVVASDNAPGLALSA